MTAKTYDTPQGRKYAAYINSTAWRKKRLEYFAEYGNDCKMDGCDQKSNNLDIHHHTYTRLGDERLTDLISLCRVHHDLVHTTHENSGKSLTKVTEEVTGVRLSAFEARKRQAPSAATSTRRVGPIGGKRATRSGHEKKERSPNRQVRERSIPRVPNASLVGATRASSRKLINQSTGFCTSCSTRLQHAHPYFRYEIVNILNPGDKAKYILRHVTCPVVVTM